MEKNGVYAEEERTALCGLAEIEDLAEKKAMIHSRLLMDVALAKAMEELAKRHEKRKERLILLGTGKMPKTENGQGMSVMNEEEEEK